LKKVAVASATLPLSSAARKRCQEGGCSCSVSVPSGYACRLFDGDRLVAGRGPGCDCVFVVSKGDVRWWILVELKDEKLDCHDLIRIAEKFTNTVEKLHSVALDRGETLADIALLLRHSRGMPSLKLPAVRKALRLPLRGGFMRNVLLGHCGQPIGPLSLGADLRVDVS